MHLVNNLLIIPAESDKYIKNKTKQQNNFVFSCCFLVMGYYFFLLKRNNARPRVNNYKVITQPNTTKKRSNTTAQNLNWQNQKSESGRAVLLSEKRTLTKAGRQA